MKTRSAFTLLELLLALALGSLILLVAITTVRSATQAVRDIERQTQENAALRSGWFAAMDDADFWRSHAEPGFPYAKGFMSAVTTYQNQYRPFREWQVDNDSDMLAISPGFWDITDSWDGIAISGNTAENFAAAPAKYPWNGDFFDDRANVGPDGSGSLRWHMFLQVIMGDDPLSSTPLQSEGYRSQGSSTSVGQPTGNIVSARGSLMLPAGWDPWHITGSYASLANIENHRGQAQQWTLFSKIGHLGVNAYIEPGSTNLIATPPRNRDAVADRSKVFPAGFTAEELTTDWGEIPYALTSAVSLDGSLAAKDDYHYVRGMPGPNFLITTMPAVEKELFRDGNPNSYQDIAFVTFTSRRLSPKLFQFGVDLDLTTARWHANTTMDYTPQVMLYPNRLVQAGSDWNADSLLTDWNIDPLRAWWGYTTWANENTIKEERNQYKHRSSNIFWSTMASRIGHVPLTAADSEGFAAELDSDIPRLSQQTLRYRRRARDQVQIRIKVQGPQGATPLSLTLQPLGTSYRGARQYWGLRGATIGRNMGDRQ